MKNDELTKVLNTSLAAARTRGDDLLPMLERWVRTNSFSGNVGGVNAVGELLISDLALPELKLERKAGNDVGDHLVWRTPAWDARPDRRVVLVGHHDTVFPPGTFDVWQIEGDHLRGPGVYDMKGGLAIARTALAALSDAGVLGQIPLAMVSVGDEEIASNDSRPFLRQLARGAQAALVFEGGRAHDLIITRRKGTGRFNVRVQGKAAHSGNGHADGINAIWAAARFVDRVQRATDYERLTTVNVGVFHGGTSTNTVPAQAECALDFRFARTADGETVVAAVERAAAELQVETGARFDLDGGFRRAPLERTEASAALFRRYGACARAASLGDGECPLIGGGSDANTVSSVGVPAIDGLGARGSGFHTPDEYIEISSLPLRVEALVRFLVDWWASTE